eukprot:m.13360 g.13360  ORF g.13360 m.13360 type:complete len:62 (+) comp4145_c1_seq1:1955-2140(+)
MLMVVSKKERKKARKKAEGKEEKLEVDRGGVVSFLFLSTPPPFFSSLKIPIQQLKRGGSET